MHLSSRLLSSCYLSLCLSVLVSICLRSKAPRSYCTERAFCLFAHLLAYLMHPLLCCLPATPHTITGFPYTLCICQHGLPLCSLWILCTDRWLEDILGSKLLSCCRERSPPPLFLAHDSGLQNTHTLSACTYIHDTYTLVAVFKNKVSGNRHGIERAVDKSSPLVCVNMNVCVRVCLIFMVVLAPHGVKE